MSKKFLVIIFGLFLVTFAAFFFVLNWGSQLSAPQNHGSSVPAAAGPVAPRTPSVAFTILKSKNGNTFRVQWENLPGNTARLNIFRSAKGKEDWSLWKSIGISIDQLGSGSASFSIGSATFSGYSFYIEAVGIGIGTGTGSGTSTPGQTILWTSSSAAATVSTATSSQTASGTMPITSSSTTLSATSTTTTVSPSGNASASSLTPQGTAYYTPQLQISGYSSGQSGTFWVQHVDQKIQIGWQNLPANTTNISVFRSPNQGGPWTTVLSQTNPGMNGYSFQIVDETVGQPNYYEMQAFAGSSVIATYGPVYLPPVGQ